MTAFLSIRKETVNLTWLDIKAGVPQESSRTIVLSDHIKGLPDALNSNQKLFADATSVFLVV